VKILTSSYYANHCCI